MAPPTTRLPIPHPIEALSERATAEGRLLTGRDSRSQEFMRVVRISREFIRGFRALHRAGPCVTFFGSSRFGEDSPFYEAARSLGSAVAQMGYTVITGGGPGLMEAANRGARDAGGPSIGATIDLGDTEPANPYLDTVIPFHYFFARKVILVKYSYGYIHMPGGFGTLDELFEAMTLIQTGRLQEFPLVLYGRSYWEELYDWIGSVLCARGAVGPQDVDRIVMTDDPERIVAILRTTAEHLGIRLRPPRG